MPSKKARKKSAYRRRNKVPKPRTFNVREIDYDSENKTQKLQSFSQVRENYFNYLQNVIRENLEATHNGNVPTESLEKISLEIEQQALLACMQSQVYQQVIMKIIHDIKRSTQHMTLYLGIQNILQSKALKDFENSQRMKLDTQNHINKTFENTAVGQMFSHIPTISSVGGNYNQYYPDWSVPNVTMDYGSNVRPSSSFDCHTATLRNENENGALSVSYGAQDVMQTMYLPSTSQNYVPSYNPYTPNYMPFSYPAADANPTRTENSYLSANLYAIQTSVFGDRSHTNQNRSKPCETITSNQMGAFEMDAGRTETMFPAQNEFQEPTGGLMTDFMQEENQKKDEQDRVRIAKILEDSCENDEEDNQYDSLSDDCDYYSGDDSPYSRRGENLLAERLEEMRQLFGMRDDDEEKTTNEPKTEMPENEMPENHIPENHMPENEKTTQKERVQRYNHVWYHERVIHTHKLALLASEMTEDMKKRNKRLFSECFGEDSDCENEMEFLREDKYMLSCKERISSWVVKYLMPFYQKNRIIGRNVFKCLGHHISSSIIDQIQYPDEWTVKYLVSKFFPTDKIFAHESDVACFQIGL